MEEQIVLNNQENNVEASRNELRKYLEKEIKQHSYATLIKGYSAHLLFWIAILASGLGAVNLGTDWFTEKGLTVLAAIPGIVLLIINTFKYEARAKWHKLKQRKLEGLLHKLIFEHHPPDKVSIELRVTLEELEKLRVALDTPKT